MFESIWTKNEPTYDFPALEAVQGEFSILLNISGLPMYTKEHQEHYGQAIMQIEILMSSINSLFDLPGFEIRGNMPKVIQQQNKVIDLNQDGHQQDRLMRF